VLQYVLHVYTMNLGFAKRLVRDLSEDQMCAQPHGLVNHPAWSLGHLAVAADHLGKLLGVSSDLPAGWEDTFKTGGIPSPDRSLSPGKDELLRVIAQQHARIAQSLSDADPAALARDHPNEKSRAHFPTVGDFAIFLVTARNGPSDKSRPGGAPWGLVPPPSGDNGDLLDPGTLLEPS